MSNLTQMVAERMCPEHTHTYALDRFNEAECAGEWTTTRSGFVRGLDNNSVFCAGYNVKWLRRIDDYAPSIIINGILVEDLLEAQRITRRDRPYVKWVRSMRQSHPQGNRGIHCVAVYDKICNSITLHM